MFGLKIAPNWTERKDFKMTLRYLARPRATYCGLYGLLGLAGSCLVFFCILWPFNCLLWQNIDLIGLESSFSRNKTEKMFWKTSIWLNFLSLVEKFEKKTNIHEFFKSDHFRQKIHFPSLCLTICHVLTSGLCYSIYRRGGMSSKEHSRKSIFDSASWQIVWLTLPLQKGIQLTP